MPLHAIFERGSSGGLPKRPRLGSAFTGAASATSGRPLQIAPVGGRWVNDTVSRVALSVRVLRLASRLPVQLGNLSVSSRQVLNAILLYRRPRPQIARTVEAVWQLGHQQHPDGLRIALNDENPYARQNYQPLHLSFDTFAPNPSAMACCACQSVNFRNSAGVTIPTPRNGFRTSKSVSPVTMQVASPEIRIIPLVGSR